MNPTPGDVQSGCSVCASPPEPLLDIRQLCVSSLLVQFATCSHWLLTAASGGRTLGAQTGDHCASALVTVTPRGVFCFAESKREKARTGGTFLPGNLGRFLHLVFSSWRMLWVPLHTLSAHKTDLCLWSLFCLPGDQARGVVGCRKAQCVTDSSWWINTQLPRPSVGITLQSGLYAAYKRRPMR